MKSAICIAYAPPRTSAGSTISKGSTFIASHEPPGRNGASCTVSHARPEKINAVHAAMAHHHAAPWDNDVPGNGPTSTSGRYAQRRARQPHAKRLGQPASSSLKAGAAPCRAMWLAP